MRIAIDIGHPAHVHYFRNFVGEMREMGHEILIIARHRPEAVELLSSLGLDFYDRGRGADTTLGKMAYLPWADLRVWRRARRFGADLFLSFGSMYAAHAAWLSRRPHIAFDDTEFSAKEQALYVPFTNVVCTPYCFRLDLGPKQLRFNGTMELAYLHPNRFQPDPAVRHDLGVAEGERYAIMRFVALKAIHDSGLRGLTPENKVKLVHTVEQHARVFISSEGELPAEIEGHRLAIPTHRFHDALALSSLYVGDSGATSAEAAALGVPAIRCSPFAGTEVERGLFMEFANYGLLHNFPVDEQDSVIDAAAEMITRDGIADTWAARREKFLADRMDVTAWMVRLVDQYPASLDEAYEST